MEGALTILLVFLIIDVVIIRAVNKLKEIREEERGDKNENI